MMPVVAGQVVEPIVTDSYEISHSAINKDVKIGNFALVTVYITNKADSAIFLDAALEGDVTNISTLNTPRIRIEPEERNNFTMTILGSDTGVFNGNMFLTGDFVQVLPVNLSIVTGADSQPEALAFEIIPKQKNAIIGKNFIYQIDFQNLLADTNYNLTVSYELKSVNDEDAAFGSAISEDEDFLFLNTTATILREFDIPSSVKPGDFLLNVHVKYLNTESTKTIRFVLKDSFLNTRLFGFLPLKWPLLLIILIGAGGFGYWYYKKKQAGKRRYVSKVDYGTLPQEGPRAAFIGKIAETTKNAYFDIDQLISHTVIAGSTGGGKTVSAEVLIEEALLKGSAVMVFDPTAQWSGMLRPNTSQGMFDLYAKFAMKKTDARGFNGNIKQILDARQKLDIRRFIKPGEITVFAVNRLDPEDIDVLVANMIKQVFDAGLEESKELKLVIIFDEVHRLLPKFGGAGQGFIQIERGAREFRKWGVGLMLISQVLTDFVGETKANIANEVQMRTRDQGDLNRIKTKYGAFMLQSLLKAATGTGMIENPTYNRGEPYFVAFRPLYHMHARLSDEELENYNKYNDMIDDLEYQIKQLDEKKVDTFDMKLELKMALDKVKAGNFNMVNIYVEGLRPRVLEQFEKLGIQPKKREIELISQDELDKAFDEAKKIREEAATEEAAKTEKKEEGPQFAPLRLATGLVVLSPQELVDALGAMADADLAKHVNAEKNDFADWLTKTNAKWGEAMKKAKTKDEMIAVLNAPPAEEPKEEKKEEKT